MPAMRDVIQQFMDKPPRGSKTRNHGSRALATASDFPDALAEHIAAERDATLTEVVAAMTKHNEQQKLPFATLTVFAHGGGSVRDGNGQLFHWPNSDNPGRTAIEVIQAHTKPEPTAAERFDEVALYAQNWRAYLQRAEKPSSDIGTSIDVVRKVLEAK